MRKGKRNSQKTEFKKGQPTRNKKSFIKIWKEKYPKEIAEQKIAEFKRKQKENNSGSKNKMYGKPSPHGAGNGWSGWYKEWFFRSFHELTYMINVIEKENLQWKSAERKDLAISYTDWNGKIRNYFADFLVNENILIECKPKALIKSKVVQAKAVAAEVFCKERGWAYQLLDPGKLSKKIIRKLHDSGNIKLVERCEKNGSASYNFEGINCQRQNYMGERASKEKSWRL